MVRAILEGRKTQTRRPIKPQPMQTITGMPIQKIKGKLIAVQKHKCPYGQPGDRLWVRESFALARDYKLDNVLNPGGIFYKATHSEYDESVIWKSSIHMPCWASRIDLEIVEVRVQRLQEINAMNCIAEGIQRSTMLNLRDRLTEEISRFKKSWDSLYAKKPEYQWEANPCVWVIEFRLCQK